MCVCACWLGREGVRSPRSESGDQFRRRRVAPHQHWQKRTHAPLHTRACAHARPRVHMRVRLSAGACSAASYESGTCSTCRTCRPTCSLRIRPPTRHRRWTSAPPRARRRAQRGRGPTYRGRCIRRRSPRRQRRSRCARRRSRAARRRPWQWGASPAQQRATAAAASMGKTCVRAL